MVVTVRWQHCENAPEGPGERSDGDLIGWGNEKEVYLRSDGQTGRG